MLERREVQSIGESRVRPVDVRVLTATYRDLRRDAQIFSADDFELLSLPAALTPTPRTLR